MEREEFKILVKGMKAVYAQPTFIPDQDAFNVWYELLKDLPYEQANIAIQKYMLTEKFPPTIADIRTKATEIIAPDEEEISELQAWALVRKALCNSNYNAENEFEKLPEACRIAVGNASNLREWALMDSGEVETIEQSHFIRNYRTALQRMKDDAKLPDSIKLLIANTRIKAQEQIAQNTPPPIEEKASEVKKEAERGGMPESARRKLDELFENLKK